MHWPLTRTHRQSEKNGDITVENKLGATRVIVEGINETSPGLNFIWGEAMKRAQAHIPGEVKNILILGLGGGGMLHSTYDLFPGCAIVAIEHDSAMIVITKELGLYKPFPLPTIIEDDAAHAISGLTETFELIAVDIFRGEDPSPHLGDAAFITLLKEKISPGGMLLINFGSTERYAQFVARQFTYADLFLIRYNYMGMFRKE